MYELIPQELKDQNTWVNAWNDSKIPMQPTMLKAASSVNPDTWGTFEMAKANVESGRYDHIGFVFTDNGYIGIDIDLGFDDGFLTPLSIDIMTLCKSYTEISKSGRGVHIILKGNLPFKGKNNRAGVEIYKTGRFFITTGQKLIFDTITEDIDGSIVSTLLERYFSQPDAEQNKLSNTIYSLHFEPRTSTRVSLIPNYTPIGEGGRNISLTSLAGQMLNWGYQTEQIFNELLKVNEKMCEPPLSIDEVTSVVLSVEKYRRCN